MGGHGGPVQPYTVPPYTMFKVEGIKPLEDLQKALEKKGLKDPWIRNEAWRYHPGFGTRASRARAVFTRGMPLGLALTVVSVTIGYLSGGDDHGHDEHH